MADTYYTITKKGEGLYKEKMSRFLSFALPVKMPEEAMALVKEYQNKYHDSRHVCWSYLVDPEKQVWQLNDNGEPSGTAGKPILGQIRSKQLSDVLVIVVRYFGGIKLGTSRLIAAYKEAARLAIEDAGVEERHSMIRAEIEFSYVEMEGVMRVIKSNDVEIESKNFDNVCQISLIMREDDREKILGQLKTNGARELKTEKIR